LKKSGRLQRAAHFFLLKATPPGKHNRANRVYIKRCKLAYCVANEGGVCRMASDTKLLNGGAMR
jgi:hypothetical protein